VNGPLRIDHWDIVSRSVGFAWKHKALWVLGFFASVSGQNVLSWVEQGRPSLRTDILPNFGALSALVAVLVFVWIALLVANLIARAGLVAASSAADAGERPTLEGAGASGVRSFLGMLALLALGVAAFLVGTLVCVVPVALPLAGGVPGVVIAVVIGAVLVLPYLAFVFALTFTVTFAERALVVERAPILAALGVGWRVTRQHFWTALVAWLVATLTTIVWGLGLFVAVLVLAIPLVILGSAHVTVALVLGVAVAVAVGITAAGAFGTYRFAFWTLLFRRLRGARADGAAAGPPDDAGGSQGRDRPVEPREDLLAGSI